jgi:hypothetical protein
MKKHEPSTAQFFITDNRKKRNKNKRRTTKRRSDHFRLKDKYDMENPGDVAEYLLNKHFKPEDIGDFMTSHFHGQLMIHPKFFDDHSPESLAEEVKISTCSKCGLTFINHEAISELYEKYRIPNIYGDEFFMDYMGEFFAAMAARIETDFFFKDCDEEKGEDPTHCPECRHVCA